MTLDELETFACIAQLGSFTEASRKLVRSQPAITRRIHQLEGALGVSLFERPGRRVALTDAGRALLPHAQAALAAARDGERAVRDLAVSSGGAQILKLAIVGTLADSHLVEALRAFEARFRDVSIELRTANSREVSALVRSGEVHLGLRYFPDADPKLESSVLGSEELVVVVPATHPHRAAPTTRPPQARARALARLPGRAGPAGILRPPARADARRRGLRERLVHCGGQPHGPEAAGAGRPGRRAHAPKQRSRRAADREPSRHRDRRASVRSCQLSS